MRIGFYTSTFSDRPFEEVADFAKSAGFDAIEIDVGGHIKTPDKVAGAVKIARDHGLYVSSITQFGNQLDPDRQKRQELRARTRDLAKAIADYHAAAHAAATQTAAPAQTAASAPAIASTPATPTQQ